VYGNRAIDVELRSQTLELGPWVGWLSIAAVASGLAFGMGAAHRLTLLALTSIAALANAVGGLIPWREWLQVRRGQLLVDVWSGALIVFVAALVIGGAPSFALLLFVTIPFIAAVQSGWRRFFWLGASAGACTTAAVVVRLPVAATAMRLVLVAAAVFAALAFTRMVRRAASRAELERALAREADHRMKNSLQTAADLLLLGRDGPAATAARLRSIATVHRLLSESGPELEARSLLAAVAEAASARVTVEAAPIVLDPSTAQKLGIVANELIANAVRHGAPPVRVRLDADSCVRLRVDDAGDLRPSAGLGLELVRQTVEYGLRGTFELRKLVGGGTRAEVVFPTGPECAS
jgi:two-component sensor histidine kinase